MNIIGKWEVAAVMSLVDGDFRMVTRDEAENIEDFDTSIFESVLEFTPDGKLLNLMKIPEGATKEQINEAVSAGMEFAGDYLITKKQDWKEEDGKVLFDSEIQGEILGEEVSPWAEIKFDDNGEFTMMDMLRFKKM